MNRFALRKTSFDSVASIYGEVRPRYGEQLYRYIDSLRKFSDRSRILEVGCGTGIATKEINSFWNPVIVALEPGQHLFEMAKEQLG